MRLLLCIPLFFKLVLSSSLIADKPLSEAASLSINNLVAQETALPEFARVAQSGSIPANGIFQPQVNIERESSENSRNIRPPVFEPSSYVRLPNGNWAPSCKHVSEGTYCLKPDGEDAGIVQCLGENVGFQFKCANGMRCYSAGPADVDCIKT